MPSHGQDRLPACARLTVRFRPVLALRLTQEDGHFRRHGLDSDLIYIRSGTEAVRDSLVDSTPQLKGVDLRKFVDDRFVKTK